jgi:hypothetical protein
MKKKLLFFALSLFAFAGNIMAETKIYYNVESVDIMQSKTAAVTMYADIDEGEVIKGFQVEFIYPEGLKAAAIAPELGAEIAANNPELQIKTSEKEVNGKIVSVYLGFQIDTTPLPTGEGMELMTFYVEADENIEPGTYPVTTNHLEFADMNTGQSRHLTPITIDFNVIPYTARILSDEDVNIPAASTAPEDVIVQRKVKADVWSTITLPFDLDGDQVKAIFGEDAKLAEFMDYDTNEKDAYVVNFESVDIAGGIPKNYPLLLKSTKEMDEFKAVDVEIDADEESAVSEYDNGKPGGKRVVYATMFGTLKAETEVPENCFFLRDNKFFVSMGDSKINAFRAYFNIVEYEYEAGANISFAIDGETTAIEGLTVNNKEITTGDVYNVNGVYMGRAENVMSTLPRGIYIVDNKKVVVK